MKKVLYFVALVIVSCNSDSGSEQSTFHGSTIENTLDTTEVSESSSEEIVNEAQQWLTIAIKTAFEKEFPNIESILTPQCTAYTSDAMNVHFSHGLTLEQFNEKWGSVYDVSLAVLDAGRFIDAQDWDKIHVEDCQHISSDGENKHVFQITLFEETFEAYYTRRVVLVPSRGAFLIDDIQVVK